MQHRTLPRATLIALLLAGSLPAQNNEAKSADRVLTQARLAENQGKLAEAERLLRVAHDKATPPVRDALAKGLREFLIRQGRETEAAALADAPVVVPAGTDPIAALIAQLESGTEGSAKVAREELGKVLELALPQLLDAVAKAGPFARLNLLQLLLPSNDPRVAERLGALLRAGDQGLALAIAKQIDSQQPRRDWRASRTVATVATVLGDAALPAEVLGGVFEVLIRSTPDDDATRRLAERLTGEPETAQSAIWALGNAKSVAWAKALLERLALHADLTVAARAVGTWAGTLGDDEEARAVAAIERLPLEHRYRAAIAATRQGWVRVGMLAITNAQHSRTKDTWQWLERVDWIRGGDAAARELCTVAATRDTYASQALRNMIRQGWRGAPALDRALVEVDSKWHEPNTSSSLLLDVLGPEGEARARAALPAAPNQQIEFVKKAFNRGLPWHDLIAEHLHHLRPDFINRSWRDAPASALDKLHAAVAGDPEGYADELLKSAHRWGGIPVRTLALLFATRQSLLALNTAIAQDPRATLDALAKAPRLDDHVRTYLDLVRQHGTAADLPFALRVAREFEFAMGCDGGAEALGRFLGRFGSGNLDVLALGEVPSTGAVETEVEGRTIAALAAAEGLQPAQVEAALALMPRLMDGVAHGVCERLEKLVQPNHAAAVAQFLDRVSEPWRAQPDDDVRAAQVYRAIRLLRTAGTPVAREALSKLVRASASVPSAFGGELRGNVAKAELHVAGEARRELLQSWLGGDDAPLAQVALGTPETSSDPALRNLGVATLRRLASTLPNDGGFLAALDAETRFAACKAIVQDDAIAKTSVGLASAALTALGDRKDPSLIPLLARGASHPHSQVRMCSANQLGRTFSSDAGATLLTLLKDDDEQVRKGANAALGWIRDYQKLRAEWEAGIRHEELRRAGVVPDKR